MSNVAEETDVVEADVTEVDAVVIGSGFAGLYATHKLRNEMGLTVQSFDNADDLAGTWYWNRYPGARSDTEVTAYCYFFDKDLYKSWDWSERYPRETEIRGYLNHVADRYDLRRSYQFSTQVESAIFDEKTSRWLIKTDRGQTFSAQFLIEGVGLLSATNIPEFKGQENFKGEIYHTARWPHEGVDLTGKRVAIIGTGSSGIQVIGEIAAEVEHLTVLQRTPQWVIPARNGPIAPEVLENIHENYEEYHRSILYSNTAFPIKEGQIAAESVSEEERREAFEKNYENGGGFQYMFTFNDVITSKVANKAATDVMEKNIREIVKDPEVADMLVPTELYARRPLCADGYYETFNRANVSLVDVKNDPIVEFTETGVKTEAGEYAADVIILATGFDAVSGNQLRIFHQGRNGETLQDKWRDRPRAYLGMTTAGFPNMFMIYGPMGPFTNQPPAHEAQMDWIADAIKHTLDSGASSIDTKVEAEDAWMDLCDEGASGTLFAEVNSWINGSNVPGKPVTNYFFMGGMGPYMDIMDEERENNFEKNFILENVKDSVDA